MHLLYTLLSSKNNSWLAVINECTQNVNKLRIIYYFTLTEDRIIYYNDNDSVFDDE